MNKFIIFVTRSPFDSLNGQTALSFCEAAINLGHSIEQVFFYQQGVQHASADIQPGSGEQSMSARWAAFSEQSKTPLNVCVTASLKRGILSQKEQNILGRHCNVHNAFHSVGMAEYFSALNTNDKASPLVSLQFLKALMTKLLIVSTAPPYYSSAAQDAIEAALAASNAGIEVTFVFAEQGLYQLLREQESALLCKKSITKQIKVLPLYDIDDIYYVEEDISPSMSANNVKLDLAKAISINEFNRICSSQSAILRF